MVKTSLTDILKGNDNEFNIAISQKGLNTKLYINKKKEVRTISVSRIRLTYDLKRFQEDTTEYVSEQLCAHQNYHELIKGRLLDAYKNLHDFLDGESNVERSFQFVPENMVKYLIEISKLVVAPKTWTKFKTSRGELKRGIQNENLDIMAYEFVETIIQYGKEFVSERLAQSNGQLPELVRVDLAEWEKVQGDLSFLYSRLIGTANKKVQGTQRLYKMFFPNSADPIQ